MAHYDPTFAGTLKIAWDNHFKKHPRLILVPCGGVSSWIRENIIADGAFFGRRSLDLVVPELPLSECVKFWGRSPERITPPGVPVGQVCPRWPSREETQVETYCNMSLWATEEWRHIAICRCNEADEGGFPWQITGRLRLYSSGDRNVAAPRCWASSFIMPVIPPPSKHAGTAWPRRVPTGSVPGGPLSYWIIS